MTAYHHILADLRQHQTLCRQLLSLAERESQVLRQDDTAALRDIYERKKTLLPRLSESLEKVRQHRQTWQMITAAERAAQPEINFLVRQVQDLIMRVILLDRGNEQSLLRRGLVPAREMTAVTAQRPHYVAGLYRRQQGA